MSLGSKIAWDDTVLPFQLDRSDIRGRVVRLDGVLDAVLAQHSYPLAVERLVAEAALLTALIGPTIKLRWKLSVQVRGDGPARLVATDFYAPETEGDAGRIRAYASFDAERLETEADPFQQIGKGYFAILIDQGPGTTPYSGLTPIAGRSLADCAQTYFAQSEQLPTRFALSFDKVDGHWRAGGVMLQKMPGVPPRMLEEGPSGDAGLLAPADLLGLPAGRLSVGVPADLLLFDPEEPWKVTEAGLSSLAKNTAFEGRLVQGRVHRTLVDGRTVFRRDAG